MKWANAVEKIELKDLLDAGLSQTFNLLKKKKAVIWFFELKNNKNVFTLN